MEPVDGHNDGGQQGVQEDAPLPLHDPTLQVAHVAFDFAPIAELYVPAEQAVGFRESKGQKEPAGQITGVPDMQ